MFGTVVEDRPDIFWYRVLEHPTSAWDGKPRGEAELLWCLEEVDYEEGDVAVSDKWKGTVAAMTALKANKNWTDAELRY